MDDGDIGELIKSLGDCSDMDDTILAGSGPIPIKTESNDDTNSSTASKNSDLTVSIEIDKLIHNAARKPLHPSTETAKLLDKIRNRNHLIQHQRSSFDAMGMTLPKISKVESLVHRERSQSLSGLPDRMRLAANIPRLVIRKLNKSGTNDSSEMVDQTDGEFLRPASTFHLNRSSRWSRSSDSSYGMSRLSLLSPRKRSFDVVSLPDGDRDAFAALDGIKMEVDADAAAMGNAGNAGRTMVDASTQTSSSLLCKCVRERISRSRRFLEERALHQLQIEIRKTIAQINELGFAKSVALRKP